MIILGIETSCDETSVAVVQGDKHRVILKANVVASSLEMHAKTGGIIPEVAARAQLKFMLPVLVEAMEKAYGFSEKNITSDPPPIDALAVTYGPGLIGPLLIGVETARTLSYVWGKPVIPVNHMMGHIYANFVRVISNFQFPISNDKNEKNEVPEFPLIALVVSGGHTDLIYMKRHGDYKVLGGTRDDAAGEAFDKIGRLLGLSYPAGAVIEERAKKGNEKRFSFPRPLLDKTTYDFSFSGLKTAVLREVMALHHQAKIPVIARRNDEAISLSTGLPRSLSVARNDIVLDDQTVNDIAAGTQDAIVDVLVKKTLKAAGEFDVKSILLSGGVAANQTMYDVFQMEVQKQKMDVQLFCPPKFLCTDNGAMIAAAAYFNHNPIDWRELTANPELYYE